MKGSLQGLLDGGATAVVTFACIAVLLGTVGIVVPGREASRRIARTEALLDDVAGLFFDAGPDLRLPAGREWLFGPGPLPGGVDPETGWPVRAWLSDRTVPVRPGRITSDGFGRALVVWPGFFQGRWICMIASAGEDGVLESSPERGIRGDDRGRLVG